MNDHENFPKALLRKYQSINIIITNINLVTVENFVCNVSNERRQN